MLDAAAAVLADEGRMRSRRTVWPRSPGFRRVRVPVLRRKEGDRRGAGVRFWAEFAELVAAVADADERDPLIDPGAVVLETLAAGFGTRPAFLALWYGGLRSASRP